MNNYIDLCGYIEKGGNQVQHWLFKLGILITTLWLFLHFFLFLLRVLFLLVLIVTCNQIVKEKDHGRNPIIVVIII